MGGLPVKPKLQGYIAQELFDEFEAYRVAHNLNQSKGLEKLLAEYFGGSIASTVPQDEVAAAASLLAAMRSELAALRLELVQRLEVVESRLATESAIPLDESAIESAVAEDVIAMPIDVSATSSADESAGEPLVEGPATEEAIAGEPEEEALVVATSEPAVVEAIAAPKSQHLNRQQLGKYFGKSHETIRQWEVDSKLDEKGWEVVPGTGSSPKKPRLYRPVSR